MSRPRSTRACQSLPGPCWPDNIALLRRDVLPEDLCPANIEPITDKTGRTTPETYGLGTPSLAPKCAWVLHKVGPIHSPSRPDSEAVSSVCGLLSMLYDNHQQVAKNFNPASDDSPHLSRVKKLVPKVNDLPCYPQPAAAVLLPVYSPSSLRSASSQSVVVAVVPDSCLHGVAAVAVTTTTTTTTLPWFLDPDDQVQRGGYPLVFRCVYTDCQEPRARAEAI